ncbi:MFS transporter [uncultured Enterovirga sp.]|uniref:MFS transporter n=1 Tax=uncultured Enterovirga sp. TaxID=2026352 RepID=UPI0035CA0D42
MDAKTGEVGVQAPPGQGSSETAFRVIATVSFCHCLNDLIQSLLPAVYPILKSEYRLDFAQVGLITLAFQLSASLLQPVVGLVTDRRPMPYSLTVGMGVSLLGLLLLATASSFGVILVAGALIGVGSAIFHPEASRIARAASGGRHGLSQSIFQVGGNLGQALGPLLAAFIVVPRGQGSLGWFSIGALVGMACLFQVGRWYASHLSSTLARRATDTREHVLSRRHVGFAVLVLVLLVFSKNFYTASFTSYYTFYLIERFGVSVQEAQIYLFVALGAIAAGTILGGPIGDRIGRKPVIIGSVLGVLPFTLILPMADLFWTVALTVPIGLILASSLTAILVYALELVPGRIGLVSGLFFGLSFGMGGLGAAALGEVADRTSIETVYRICAWLPAIGILAFLLPAARERAEPR